MKDFNTLHQKIQEHMTCFAASDLLKEMSRIADEENSDDAAVKWLALTVLHGINSRAETIEFTKNGDGRVRVSAGCRKSDLPDLPPALGDRVLETARQVIHVDRDRGKSLLSLGLGRDSLVLEVSVDSSEKGERVSLKFPDNA